MQDSELYLFEFIFPAAQPDFFPVLELNGPIDIGVQSFEFVFSRQSIFFKARIRKRPFLVDQIYRSLVNGDRIGGGHHPDVAHDGGIVKWRAVTGRRDIRDKVDKQRPVCFALVLRPGYIQPFFLKIPALFHSTEWQSPGWGRLRYTRRSRYIFWG